MRGSVCDGGEPCLLCLVFQQDCEYVLQGPNAYDDEEMRREECDALALLENDPGPDVRVIARTRLIDSVPLPPPPPPPSSPPPSPPPPPPPPAVDYTPATLKRFRRKPLKKEQHRKKTRSHTKVSAACTMCQRVKVKCTGTTPCERCVRYGFECMYVEQAKRGRKLGTSRDDLEFAAREARWRVLAENQQRLRYEEDEENRRSLLELLDDPMAGSSEAESLVTP